MYNGLVTDMGVKEKRLTAVFGAAAGALETEKKIASSEKIAEGQERGAAARSAAQIAATLNTPDRLVFNQLMKDSGNDAVKAAEALQKMKAEKFNMYEAYSKYLTGFAGKDTTLGGPPETFTKFASRFAPPALPKAVDTGKADRS